MFVSDKDGEPLRWPDGGFVRAVRASTLRELLSKLEDDPLLYVNRVGNLSITTDDIGNLIGIIDFGSEVIELYEDGN